MSASEPATAVQTGPEPLVIVVAGLVGLTLFRG
jgi:hypothetical protein